MGVKDPGAQWALPGEGIEGCLVQSSWVCGGWSSGVEEGQDCRAGGPMTVCMGAGREVRSQGCAMG